MNPSHLPAASAHQWTPDFWQSWREADNPYRRHKSQRDRQIALELLSPRSGERILEVGCGYGWISLALWNAAPIEWVGMDRSQTMLHRLRSAPGAQSDRSLQADAAQLPFTDGAFDKVLCTGVLMHIAECDLALSEMIRVLKPGGCLLCSVNNSLSPFSWAARLWNLHKRGFVQKFHIPSQFRRRLRQLGMEPQATAADGILTSVSIAHGRLSFPPRFTFPILRRVDAWLLRRVPELAYEIWFAAVKGSTPCAS
jgi:SAM-dependent methyltransferase